MDQITITKLSKAIKQYWDLVRGRRSMASSYRGSIWAKRMQIHRMLIDKRSREFARIVADNYAVVQMHDENIELVSSAFVGSYNADDVKAVFELQNFVAWILDGANLVDIRADIYQENVDVQVKHSSLFDEDSEVPLVSPFGNVDNSLMLSVKTDHSKATITVGEADDRQPLYESDMLEWSAVHEDGTTIERLQISAGRQYVIPTRSMAAGKVTVTCRRLEQKYAGLSAKIDFMVERDTETVLHVAKVDEPDEFIDFCITSNEISENNVEWRYAYTPYGENERSSFAPADSNLQFPLSIFTDNGENMCLSIRVLMPNKQHMTRTYLCRLLDVKEDDKQTQYIFDFDGINFIHVVPKEVEQTDEEVRGLLENSILDIDGKFFREKSRGRIFRVSYIISPPTKQSFEEKSLREFHKKNSVVVLQFKNGNTHLLLMKDFLEEMEQIEDQAGWQ